MLSVRRASKLVGSALLLCVALGSQVHAMPVIGELQRLQGVAQAGDATRQLADASPGTKDMSVVEARKTPTTANVESSSGGLLRLDQQTLVLVVAGFAAALSLMARLR